MKTGQLDALTTSQLRALTTEQTQALTTAAIATYDSTTIQATALTTAGIAALTSITPIVLDLDGGGVNTLAMASGVVFDLAATGQMLHTGWVAGGDGLLVMDRNHDGAINDGAELFGSATRLESGAKAADGFVALRPMDANGDGAITGADSGFDDLRVWVDGNADGMSQTSELSSLAARGITQLNLNATASTTMDNGNLLGLVSSYLTLDGAKHDMADVWFAAGATAVVSNAGAPADLRSKVSGLAQAIAEFNDRSDATATTAPLDLTPGAEAVAQGLAVSTQVEGIVGLLKQHCASGNLSGTPVLIDDVMSRSPSEMLDWANPADKGLLATSGK